MLTRKQTRQVQSAVWEADLALGQRDYQLASQKMWDATALAIKFVAEARGWSHATFEDIYAAGQSIAREQDDDSDAVADLNFAECYRANAKWHMIDDSELVEDWELATWFIDRILGHPVRQLTGMWPMLTRKQTRQVQSTVWEADEVLGQQDYQLASQKMWDATALAIRFVAEARGWPHATFEDIYAAGQSIAREQDDESDAVAELNFAESYRASAQRQMSADSELVENWELATRFIDRMLRPIDSIANHRRWSSPMAVVVYDAEGNLKYGTPEMAAKAQATAEYMRTGDAQVLIDAGIVSPC